MRRYTGYSRNYVPRYVELTQPLRDMVSEAGNRNLTASLSWTIEGEDAFTRTKQALAQAVALSSPYYTQPFYLDVHKKVALLMLCFFRKRKEKEEC